MKKNKMMRLASILLVCVLLTTSVISGTFAKYTSSATGSDTARVAKWGWGDTTVTLDLFDGAYGETVKSSDSDKVIAPGTGKTATILWTPASTFEPEVDYTISFAATATIPADVENVLTWTLAFDGAEAVEYATFEQLAAALNAKTYAGEATQDAPEVDVVIGWAWAIDGDAATDTALGNKVVLDKLTVNVTLTATQVG